MFTFADSTRYAYPRWFIKNEVNGTQWRELNSRQERIQLKNKSTAPSVFLQRGCWTCPRLRELMVSRAVQALRMHRR